MKIDQTIKLLEAAKKLLRDDYSEGWRFGICFHVSGLAINEFGDIDPDKLLKSFKSFLVINQIIKRNLRMDQYWFPANKLAPRIKALNLYIKHLKSLKS